MNKYKTFLLFPVFKNNKFCQNQIFNQKNFISRSLETRSLVQALDGRIIFERIVNIYVPKPPLLVSKTIANEIKDNFNIDKIDLIIIDCSLSPIQNRNWERFYNKKIIDRKQIIIELFGWRAATKEGKVQVKIDTHSFKKAR